MVARGMRVRLDCMRMADNADNTATIPAVLQRAAREFPDTEAVIDGQVRLNFSDLYQLALDVTKALLARGVEHGDRVAIWAPNDHRWVAMALGAVSAGAVLLPVNTRYTGTEASDLLSRGKARLLLIEDGFLDKGYLEMLGGATTPDERPAPSVAGLDEVVTLDERPGTTGWDEFLASGASVSDEQALARWQSVGADNVADVLFTSGTTGTPKGVLCTHGQNVGTYDSWCARTELASGDRYLIVNPLFHCFGYKAGVLACLLRGATMVVHRVFDVQQTLRTVQQERISVLPGPPTIYSALLEDPQRSHYDLSTLRLAVTGSAVVPVALVRRIRAELFPQVVTAYGLTEACGTVTACSVRDDDETVAATAGRAIAGVEIALEDERGEPVPTDRDGHILVRGPNVMVGYVDDPEASAEAVHDGWLRTGDVGRMDEGGALTITGRLKDMLTVGGFNVYPAEVEQVLVNHPAVSEAAVVAAPDARLGEVAHAHVVTRGNTPTTGEELLSHCRGHLANFKVPARVTFTGALPRNAAGKVDKSRLTSEEKTGDSTGSG